MVKKQQVDNFEKHLQEKRNEIIWALSLQDYTFAQIGRIFKLDRATVLRIVDGRPRGWKPKWIKVNN